jgi:valyl-tRNA synthetase
VRSLRKDYGVGEGAGVAVVLDGVPDRQRAELEDQRERLKRLAKISDLTFGDARGRGVGASAVLSDGIELFVPLEGLLDLDRERERLRAEISRLGGQLEGAEKKLGNANFVERAPQEVVRKEEEKASSFRDQRSKLLEKLSTLERP